MWKAFQKQLENLGESDVLYAFVHRYQYFEIEKFKERDIDALSEKFTLLKMPEEPSLLPSLVLTADIARIEEDKRLKDEAFRKSWANATHSFPNY